ncbi:MAG TPA: 50S ribosomal protein L6 [Clostridiaceae bacterium]|jgi:large subunit ribosomal protein L6|nr:50S ribosomal protein L6 [Clostridiaceae bacterium]
MSRIGKKPIVIPDGIKVEIVDGHVVVSKGQQSLSQVILPGITVSIEDGQVLVGRENDTRQTRSLHGLSRSLINNMVVGLHEGFTKNLEIQGVGYRAMKEGNKLVMNLGYSHQVIFEEPEGITFELASPTRIAVKGADKQLVGEMAAKIRASRPPDAYKGKGVRYAGEVLRLKVGKSGVR